MSTISQTTRRLITADELMAMPDHELCELVAGEIVRMTPSFSEHGEIAARICCLLGVHAARHKLGPVYTAEAGFFLKRNPDTVLAPDVSFVRRERRPKSPRAFVEGAPDLVVEVVSSSDRARRIEGKTEEWLAGGTSLVWIVWPETRSVVVHRPGQPPRTLQENETISGQEVLLGFECRVAEFFAD